MSENDRNDQSKSWLEKLSMAFINEPTSRDELISLLRAAQQRELLDDEALSIIEGAMAVSKMKTREIMVPRSQVVFVQLDMTPEEFLPLIIDSGHSRFSGSGRRPGQGGGYSDGKGFTASGVEQEQYPFQYSGQHQALYSHPGEQAGGCTAAGLQGKA